MGLKNKGRHPDPAIELKLRKIRNLDELRRGCHLRIADSLHAIREAEVNMRDLSSKRNSSWNPMSEKTYQSVIDTETARVKRLERTIQQERATVRDITAEIEQAIADALLTEADLKYLNLS